MVVIFLLIILLAMEFIGSYASRSLGRYYVDQHRRDLRDRAELLAGFASQPMAQIAETGAAEPAAAPEAEAPSRPRGSSQAQLDRLFPLYVPVRVEAFFTDTSWRVVASSSTERLGQPLGDGADLLRRAQETGMTVDELRSGPGGRSVHVAAPVVGGGQIKGFVYLIGSLEQIDAVLRGMRPILATSTLVALLVAAVLSYILARTITGPVKELTARAGEMAGGRFDRLIEVRSSDEIGRLAGMFNHLTVRLRDTLEEISAEKRKAEAILNHMADGIIAVDRESRVMLLNPAAARMLRVAPEEVVGGPLLAVLPDLPLEGALSAVLAGREEEPGEVTVPRRGMVLRARLAPLRDPAGQPAGLVIVFHDITQQEKLETMRREFVANVSHELRTPITTIKSYVETLLEGARDEPEVADRFLRVVAGETDRMVRLVNDLLTLSQIDSRRMRWEMEALDLGGLVAEVGEKFADRCRRKGLALDVAAAQNLPEVWGDRDRLEQVLSNLLNNAVDFTPADGAIHLSAEAEGDRVVVRVRDTGVGIPPEDLPRIFERFYRVDKARSREFGGTGLGLAIAREIVEAHGGRIEINSAPGRGTEVRFDIPVRPADAGSTDAAGAAGGLTARARRDKTPPARLDGGDDHGA